MKIKKVVTSVLLTALLTISMNSLAFAQGPSKVAKSGENTIAAQTLTPQQWEELKANTPESNTAINNAVSPMWEYREVWDHFEPGSPYMIWQKYLLGTSHFINNTSNNVTATYTQSYTASQTSTYNTLVSGHIDATNKIITVGATLGYSVTDSSQFTAGSTLSASTIVGPYQSVFIDAYRAGVNVDGTAVYSLYDTSGYFQGYSYKPANNNVVVAPNATTLVVHN